MKIRKATVKDAHRISYLIQKNTDNFKNNHYSLKQKRAWKKANKPAQIKKQLSDREIFCAIEHGRMIGTIALKGNEVLDLFVSYSKREGGIGSKLLLFLEKYAKKKRLTKLRLTSTPSAYYFYRRRGYAPKGRVTIKINGVDFPETEMEKRL